MSAKEIYLQDWVSGTLIHCKKGYWFQPGFQLFPASGSLVSDIPSGTGKPRTFFYSVGTGFNKERYCLCIRPNQTWKDCPAMQDQLDMEGPRARRTKQGMYCPGKSTKRLKWSGFKSEKIVLLAKLLAAPRRTKSEYVAYGPARLNTGWRMNWPRGRAGLSHCLQVMEDNQYENAAKGLIICRTIAAVVGACRTKKQPSTNEIMLQCLYTQQGTLPCMRTTSTVNLFTVHCLTSNIPCIFNTRI